MNSTFTLNGNTIVAKRFDFNLVCDMEDMGVSIQKAQEKPMAMVRAYIACCLNADTETAGKQMEEHIIAGGSFDDVMAVMAKEMESSDFFRHLSQPQTVQKKAPKGQTKA